MVKSHDHEEITSDSSKSFIIVLGVIIILFALLMMFSFSQKIFVKDKPTDDYNNYKFQKQVDAKGNIFWTTEIQKPGFENILNVTFYNHPNDLEDYFFDNSIVKRMIMHRGVLYIALKPDMGATPVLAGVNIARITGKFYEIETRSALYDEFNDLNETSFPVLSCADSSNDLMVLWIKKGETDRVYIDSNYNNCIVLEATDVNQTLVMADLIGYKLLGIMR